MHAPTKPSGSTTARPESTVDNNPALAHTAAAVCWARWNAASNRREDAKIPQPRR